MEQTIKANKLQVDQQTILTLLQIILAESKAIMHIDSQSLRTRFKRWMKTILETIQEALEMKIWIQIFSRFHNLIIFKYQAKMTLLQSIWKQWTIMVMQSLNSRLLSNKWQQLSHLLATIKQDSQVEQTAITSQIQIRLQLKVATMDLFLNIIISWSLWQTTRI